MPDFAPGIPNRENFGELTSLPAGQLSDYFLQSHKAHKAGPHFDLRLGTPQSGLFSWAIRKGLPQPGQKHLAIAQPLHSHSYGSFEGEIPSGYGAGTVKKEDAGQALVTKVTPKEVHFTLAHQRYPTRFALIKPEKGEARHYLLMNTTPTAPIPYEKTRYLSVPAEQAEDVLKNLQPNSSVQTKIDGAAALARLGRKHIEVASYRTAAGTGYPLIHSERVFHGRPEFDLPKELEGTVLRGELYGHRQGKAIPPQELGGLLNATVGKSIANQKSRGIDLKTMLFDIQQLGKQPVSRDVPYIERQQMLRKVLEHLPANKFHLPEEAYSPEEALDLWRGIASNKNPLSHEGVVVHQPQGKPSKIKLRQEHDVHLAGFFPGEGRLQNKGVGGFSYSWQPGGPVAGRVGTGLSDELRRQMHVSPAEYLGRVARVIAQQKLPSGALRAPALLALHEDYPTRAV